MTFDLTKELASAAAGAVLRLPSGDYGDVRLSAKFAEPVTITAADPASPPRFRSLTLVGCAGVVLDGLAVDWKPTATTLSSENAISVRSGERVRIRNCRVVGYPAVAGIAADTPKDAARDTSMIIGWPTGRGVYFETSKDVGLEDTEITGFHRGVVAYKVDGLDMLRNNIHHNRGSTFSANGLSRALFEANHLHSSSPWAYGGNGDHGDFIAIQFASGQTTTNADIKIINNLLDQGDGAPIMGMLIGGQPGTEGLVIEGNIILGGHTQAILINQIISGRLANNLARRIGGEAKTSPGLLTRDVPAKFEFVGNTLGSAVMGAGTKSVEATNGNRFDQTEATPAELTSLRQAWRNEHRPAAAIAATPATLTKVIDSAPTGSVIALAAGAYGDVRIKGKKGLSFRGGPKAVLRSLIVAQCSDMAFSGVVCEFTPRNDTYTWSAAVLISECQNVSFTDGKLTGGLAVTGVAETAEKTNNDGNVLGRPTGKGIDITKSTGVVVTGNILSTFDRGIGIGGGVDILVADNEISGLRRTAITGAGCHDVVVARNRLGAAQPWRWSETPVGDHGDYIAFWTDAAFLNEASRGVKIIDNVAIQGGGGAILGMWLQGGDLGFDAPVISRNAFLIGNGQGITLKDCRDPVVEDNVLLQSSGGDKDGPGILYTGRTVNARARGNITTAVNDLTSPKTGTNEMAAGNTLVQRASKAKPGFYDFSMVAALATLKTAAEIRAAALKALGQVVVEPEPEPIPEPEPPVVDPEPEPEAPTDEPIAIVLEVGKTYTFTIKLPS